MSLTEPGPGPLDPRLPALQRHGVYNIIDCVETDNQMHTLFQFPVLFCCCLVLPEDGVEELNVLEHNLAAFVHPLQPVAGTAGGQMVRATDTHSAIHNASTTWAATVRYALP